MAKQTFTTGQVLTAAQMTDLQATAMGGGAASTKTANYVLVAADAGTTIAMNAAGATTITVNTGLFSAGDTVFIQNIGAGATTITAGTATVNTAGSLILPQYDAGILYFTSASAAIFYDYIQVGAVSPLTTKGDLYTFSTSDTRLGVGANGHVLTADSVEATGLKWAAPAGGTTFSGVSVANSAVQSIANNTNTALTFNSEIFDTDGYHSTSSNTSRLTIPTGKNGYYFITANFAFALNATGNRDMFFAKNGTAIRYATSPIASSSTYTGFALTFIANLVATDYIELFCAQTSGGNLNADTTIGGGLFAFQMQYLGA